MSAWNTASSTIEHSDNSAHKEHENCYRAFEAIISTMKTNITLVLLMLALASLWLSVGFYETRFAEDNRVVFFIKKQPALQVQFENIFLTDEEEKPLERLSDEERRAVINYCKYRLGIETELKTQEELETCKQR